jgi:hypothetical protein
VTTVPAPEPVRFDAVLSRTWALFKPNWTIALPPVIAFVIIMVGAGVLTAATVVAVLGTAATRHAAPDGGFVAGLVLGILVFTIVAVLLGLWGATAMYGMADAVWTRGSATLADGNAAFAARFGAVIVACVGLIGVFFVAMILALPTLGLALLALPLVTMYVFPAVVSGHRGGFEAIGESFQLVRRFFVPSALTLLILYAIAYGLGLIGSVGIIPLEFSMMGSKGDVPVLPPIPLLVVCGVFYLGSLVISVIYSGFQALALVGLYRELVARPDLAPPVPGFLPPPGPPPPAPVVPG